MSLPDVDYAAMPDSQAARFRSGPEVSGQNIPGLNAREAVLAAGSADTIIKYLDFTPKPIELIRASEPEDENDVPTWVEMAEDTYFMIFIDASDSMNSNNIASVKSAADLFIEYLTDEVYEGDSDTAGDHVIVEEVMSERYLQHMAAWNKDVPQATRYVNIFLTNEADQDYYTESSILYPTEKFTDDLNGDQDGGGLIYGLRNELEQRTFSIGKIYNVGGRQGNNIGGFHPAFATHLYCAFNNVGDYADTNLGDLGLSYENIESGLSAEEYVQCFIDALDYSAAYISEPEPGEDPIQVLQQRGKRNRKKGIRFLI
jgi:hypothetical protein